jgi:hypothetical protein
MKVYAFPADEHGCGHYRIIWPAEQLIKDGVDVTLVKADSRDVGLQGVIKDDRLVDVHIPADADVMVLQRVSHRFIADAIPIIRAKGVAVVVEIDDDLTRIDPRNPAFNFLHPGTKKTQQDRDHSWHNTVRACQNATMVVTSTPALLDVFARHGRGRVFDNYIQEKVYEIPRLDHNAIGWAGSVHSHPGDLQVMGSSVNQLVQQGYDFMIIGTGEGAHQAWGLTPDTGLRTTGATDVHHWPFYVSQLGVGVAPLADTKFNAAKSWLKMAEMAAAGVPCIGSPRAEYLRLHKLTGVGWMAKDPGEWKKKIKLLADDAILREEMSQQGRESMRPYTMEGNAWRLAEIWEEAWKLEKSLH